MEAEGERWVGNKGTLTASRVSGCILFILYRASETLGAAELLHAISSLFRDPVPAASMLSRVLGGARVRIYVWGVAAWHRRGLRGDWRLA